MNAANGSATRLAVRSASKRNIITTGKDIIGHNPHIPIHNVSHSRSNTGSRASSKDSLSLQKEWLRSLNFCEAHVATRVSRRRSFSTVSDVRRNDGYIGARRDSTSTTSTRSSSKTSVSSCRLGSKHSISSSDEQKRRHSIQSSMLNASAASCFPSATSPPGSPPKGRILGVRAARLAFKYRLSLDEVKHIFECWSEMKVEDDGTATIKHFETMLCAVFRVKEIPRSVLNSAFEATYPAGVEVAQQIDNFVSWYVQHMFISINQYNADMELVSSNAKDYALAKRYSVSTSLVDRIKHKFQQFDSNRSGRIDYAEFSDMMKSFLGIKSNDQLDTGRLQRFWKEIDSDGGGDVDFHEFCSWYIKHFASEGKDSVGPQQLIASFYHSFNPVVQRHIAYERGQSSY